MKVLPLLPCLSRKVLRSIMAALLAGSLTAEPRGASAQDMTSAPTVTIGETKEDGAARTTVLNDIRIVFPGTDHVTLRIGKLTLTDLKRDTASFEADKAVAENTALGAVGGETRIEIPQITLVKTAGPMPDIAALSIDVAAGRLPPLLHTLLAFRAGSVTAPHLVVRGARNTITYTDLTFSDLAEGKLGNGGFAGMESSSEASRAKVGKTAIANLDFNAFAAWFDDDIAAKLGSELRTAYSSAEANDFSFGNEGDGGSLDKISSTDLKLAPPGIKPSELFGILKHFDADAAYADAHPAEVATLIQAIWPKASLGSLDLSGLDVRDRGKAPFSMARFHIGEASGSRIGEIRLEGIAGDDQHSDAPFTLGSAFLRGLALTDLDRFLDLLKAGKAPGSVDYVNYPKPRIDSIGIENLAANDPVKGPVSLDSFTVEAPDWVGMLPSTLNLHLKGLKGTAASMEPEEAQALLQLGISTLEVNSDIRLAWKADDETLNIGQASVEIVRFGRINLTGVIGSVKKTVFDDPSRNFLDLLTADFRGGSITAEDQGGFAKLLQQSSAESAVTTAQIAEEASRSVLTSLTPLLGADNASKVAGAVGAFVLDPKRIAITAKTSQPIMIGALLFSRGLDSLAMDELRKNITIEARAN